MLYDLLLYADESSWGKAVGAAIGGALVSLIIYEIGRFKDKRIAQKQTKIYNEEKADAFIKSDRHGNGDYNKYLLNELLDKCNPQNFMNPYNYEKVKIANELYPRLQKCDGNDNDELIEIRKEAISKLGIILSTSTIFEELCKTCNPQQFMNPYNPDKVAKANELYSRVLQNKTDIDALENIRDEARILFDNAQQLSQQEKDCPSQLNSSDDDCYNTQVKTQQEDEHLIQTSSSDDYSAETPIIVICVILTIVLMVSLVIRCQT